MRASSAATLLSASCRLGQQTGVALSMVQALSSATVLPMPLQRRFSLITSSSSMSLVGSQRYFSASRSALHTELQMPALSPTMEKGNILSWKKQVGEKVKAGDVICVIETDKATIDWEATDDGYLAAILTPDNTQNITVGSTVAIVVDSEKEVADFANYKASAASSSSAPPAAAPAPAAAAPAAAPSGPAKTYPPHLEVSMPALSPTMEKGTLLQWKKAVGDAVKPGDLLCIIETDKATIDFEATESGYLAAILVPDGTQNVVVGALVGVLAEDQASIPAFADFSAASSSQAAAPPVAPSSPAAPAPAAAAAPSSAAPAVQSTDGRVFSSPRARAVAAEKGFDIRSIPGTGPNNRVIQADVLSFVPQVASTAAAAAAAAAPKSATTTTTAPPSLSEAYVDIPHTNIRKIIAERLTFSKQTIPHYYLQSDINVDELLALRTEMNESAKGAFKLSVNDFIVKAAAIALRQSPDVNSQWMDTAIRRFSTVDINVAVATDQGLLTPLVRNADNIGLVSISQRVRDLAQAAKERKINPVDLAPGTFTISNLGMFGITSFSAVINPPQACILAVGGTEKRVVVDESKSDDEPAFKVVNMMSVTLSCDHRVVDGAVGALFLQKFKSLVERPTNMLLY